MHGDDPFGSEYNDNTDIHDVVAIQPVADRIRQYSETAFKDVHGEKEEVHDSIESKERCSTICFGSGTKVCFQNEKYHVQVDTANEETLEPG